MQEIKTSGKGIDYINKVLLDKATVITRASFWGIPRTNHTELHLKIGRYKKNGAFAFPSESLKVENPKSELTLDGNEFDALIELLQEVYLPFKDGVKKYFTVDDRFSAKNLECLEDIFSHPNQQELVDFMVDNKVIPNEFLLALRQASKVRAIKEFEDMLMEDSTEHDWQSWFEVNSWILGTEYVQVLEERTIDTANISDFLMQAYDGFVDIVEIKRPNKALRFWTEKLDHNNYVPHPSLVKAITQCVNYIYEVERESNSVKFLERVDYTKTVKPRCVLIYGRSNDWNKEQNESYRILNSSYHNLNILTYDHVLDRARRLLS